MHLLVIYIGIASSFSVGYEWHGMLNETTNLKIGKFLDAPVF